MAADDNMDIDSEEEEPLPPSKRPKLSHHSSSRKRLERDLAPAGVAKRAKKSLPTHDRPNFVQLDLAKRRKVHSDHSPRPTARRRGSDHVRIEDTDGCQPSSQERPSAKVCSDISQSNDQEVISDIAENDVPDVAAEEVVKQGNRRKVAIDQAMLEQRVEDRLRRHRVDEIGKERLAERKERVQARIQEHIHRRAAGKSPAELLAEFCGIQCSERGRQALKKAYKRSLAQLHPDRMLRKPLEEMVQAEEIYKLLQPIYCDL